MKLVEWALIAEIVSAATVLVSIIYLALQVRQNTASNQADAFQTWVTARTDLQSSINDNNLAQIIYSGLNDPCALNEDTWFQFGCWWLSWYQITESINYLYKSGAVPEERWRSEMEGAAAWLKTPGVKQWWQAGARTQLSSSFVSELESFPVSQYSAWHWEKGVGFIPYGGGAGRNRVFCKSVASKNVKQGARAYVWPKLSPALLRELCIEKVSRKQPVNVDG